MGEGASDQLDDAGHRGRAGRILAASLLLGGAALVVILSVIRWGLSWGWNSARLAPSFALANGYHLYYGPDEGPVLNTLYGPITALVYLPATLGATPSEALLIGSAISSFLFFAPVTWLLLGAGRPAPRNVEAGILALVCFVFAAERSYPLAYSAFTVHADAPALGLGALACTLIYQRRDPRDRILLPLSACSAVLAIWSKQTMVLLPAAVAVYLWLTGERVSARRFLTTAGAFGAVSLALFWTAFDGPAMVFNLVTIPGHHPLRGEETLTALWELGELVLPAVVTLVAFNLVGLAAPLRRAWRAWLADSRWTLFVLVAAFNVPLSVLNRIKTGGDTNAYSLTAYPLLIATLLLLVDTASSLRTAGAAPLMARRMLTVVVAGLALLLLTRFQEVPVILSFLDADLETQTYRAIRAEPGKVYFPQRPLAHIMAERKVYHLAYGLLDRRLAGFPVGENHFRANIPVAAERVAFNPFFGNEEQREVLERMPELLKPPEEDADWVVFRRGGGR